MVKYYHGVGEKEDVDNILKVGLVAGLHLKKNSLPYVYIAKHKKFASHYGKYSGAVIELNIPKSKIHTGNEEGSWIQSGKPIWQKGYREEAIVKGGIPKKYVKAIIINGVRFKI